MSKFDDGDLSEEDEIIEDLLDKEDRIKSSNMITEPEEEADPRFSLQTIPKLFQLKQNFEKPHYSQIKKKRNRSGHKRQRSLNFSAPKKGNFVPKTNTKILTEGKVSQIRKKSNLSRFTKRKKLIRKKSQINDVSQLNLKKVAKRESANQSSI